MHGSGFIPNPEDPFYCLNCLWLESLCDCEEEPDWDALAKDGGAE